VIANRRGPRRGSLASYSLPWNFQFTQAQYCYQQGNRLKLNPDPYTAGFMYDAYRSEQMFAIWQQVFGSQSSRIVRVIAGQAANTYIAQVRLQYAPTGADVLAIAPYFDGNGPNDPKNAHHTANETVAQLLAQLNADMTGRVQGWTTSHAALAQQYGIPLATYEGGQGLVTPSGIPPKLADRITALFERTNRDPGIGSLYTAYLNQLGADGISLYMNFSYVGPWSKYGSWPALEHQDEAPARAPKYAALTSYSGARASLLGDVRRP
jgi:hypothetical protein